MLRRLAFVSLLGLPLAACLPAPAGMAPAAPGAGAGGAVVGPGTGAGTAGPGFGGEAAPGAGGTGAGGQATIAPAARVSTLAGGELGYADGPAAAARFFRPWAIAAAPDGGVFVADSGNDRIRRIAPDGTVATVAGDGREGLVNGQAREARFDHPDALALGPDGTLYILELHHATVRALRPDGTVVTIAGADEDGFADGPGTAARFHSPSGLAADAGGNLYVADTGNDRIRKITPDGLVTTLAGSGEHGERDGPGAEASFLSPVAVAVGPEGRVFVGEGVGHRVRVVEANGLVRTLAGGPEAGYRDGEGSAARFSGITGLAVDGAGVVYATEAGNHGVRRIASELVTVFAGAAVFGWRDGASLDARFAAPGDVDLAPDGTLVVADTENHRVRRVTRL